MHFGADDESFQCMGNGQDDEGNRGIVLQKTIIGVTTRAMRETLTAMAPLVLPFSELVRLAQRKAALMEAIPVPLLIPSITSPFCWIPEMPIISATLLHLTLVLLRPTRAL